MNWKQVGDRGQNCVIGHLSRYGLGIAFPLSDNYPFDFVIIAGDKLFKAQVKSSSYHMNGSIFFGLSTNNFYKGTTYTYTAKHCDVILGYDLRRDVTYILTPKEFEKKRSFTIRFEATRNGQEKTINWHDDYALSEQKIKDIFSFSSPDFAGHFAVYDPKAYDHICKYCGKDFTSPWKTCKYCGENCRSLAQRKVDRPSKEDLQIMIDSMTWTAIGKKYGVVDNTVRKWAKSYGLISSGPLNSPDRMNC
jgi:hypothetical protein